MFCNAENIVSVVYGSWKYVTSFFFKFKLRMAIQGRIDAEAKGQVEEVNEEVEEIDPQNLEVELPPPQNEYRLVNTANEDLQDVQVIKED